MFVVRGYTDHKQDASEIPGVYRAYLKKSGMPADGLIEGKPTEVMLAGAKRPAVPFIHGKSMARGNWCVVFVRSPRAETDGLMVMAGVGAPDEKATEPDCERSMNQAAIKVMAGSLTLE